MPSRFFLELSWIVLDDILNRLEVYRHIMIDNLLVADDSSCLPTMSQRMVVFELHVFGHVTVILNIIVLS